MCSYSIEYVVVHITTMTKGKSMMGPGSDRNTKCIKLNLEARAGICMLRKGKKKYREIVFSGRRMSITQVIITAWSWRKITFENCLPCPAKSPWILTRSHFEVLLIAPSLLHNTHSTTFTCKFLAIINVGIWEPKWIKIVPLF